MECMVIYLLIIATRQKEKGKIMDDFGKQLETDLLFTLDRIRSYERNKTIAECLDILRFHRDSWDGIEWAIRDIEELKRKEK